MGFGLHIAQDDRPFFQLVVADNQRMAGIESIGALHQAFEAFSAKIQLRPDAFIAESADPFKCLQTAFISQCRHKNIGFPVKFSGIQAGQFGQPVKADGKAGRRNIGPSQLFDQSIIATAAGNRILRAQ